MNGDGIQYGLDFEKTMSLLRSKAFKADPARKGVLETVMSAGCWPNGRVHDAYPNISALCSRCGVEVETDSHTFWGCSANSELECEEVIDSQDLIPEALAGCRVKP